MNKRAAFHSSALMLALAAYSAGAYCDQPIGTVRNFGPNLQQTVCRQPEGIAADSRGHLYASSNSDTATIGHVCVFDRHGTLVDIIEVPAGTSPVIGLLGELFEEDQGLYVVDQADNVAPNGRLLKIDPRTHAVTLLATGFSFPNAIAQDWYRNLYVSDSLTGQIARVAPDGSGNVVWIDSPLLRTNNPDQPVGANGLAFDRDHRFLYVANTGDHRILRIPVRRDGSAGLIEIFADGATINAQLGITQALFGADGIQFDVRGNLYVLANQAEEIQVLSPDGRLIARYAGSGADALDFPASLVFEGDDLYIANMSAQDGGVNSKLSVFEAPHSGLPLDPR
ncbi:MAG TPA: SMP-30/gluconolactonase/LRE family protein [Burkholderiales bacterium]|nr:SMP-30/gluconolactonase/LRE family protein [Burkholderiales bacterium]